MRTKVKLQAPASMPRIKEVREGFASFRPELAASTPKIGMARVLVDPETGNIFTPAVETLSHMGEKAERPVEPEHIKARRAKKAVVDDSTDKGAVQPKRTVIFESPLKRVSIIDMEIVEKVKGRPSRIRPE